MYTEYSCEELFNIVSSKTRVNIGFEFALLTLNSNFYHNTAVVNMFHETDETL